MYGLARSNDAAVMSAGMKALHNVLLRAQHLEGVDHIFSSTVSHYWYLPGMEHTSGSLAIPPSAMLGSTNPARCPD